MIQQMTSPLIIDRKRGIRRLELLSRSHREFDEKFLQELLVDHPELLPVYKLRDDVGHLLCIGREVVAGDSGSIDNLYISTGGYPVIVETKLWRNPQARREVLSQVLDYTKELVSRDFEWFEQVWKEFGKGRYGKQETLIEKLNEYADEEIDESVFVDRFHRALRKGDILALIVGDGIETRLQQLVSHLCRDSAHLRYSLALVELSCYRMNDDKSDAELLVVPRFIQEVEPVQRAYVRIELAPELGKQLQVKSVVSDEEQSGSRYARTNLSEEDFFIALNESVGVSIREKVEQFYRSLVAELGLEPDFKAAAIMLKVPDPKGERPGVSVLAIERQGRIYNTKHMINQLDRWGLSQDTIYAISSEFWKALHQIDNRFLEDGIIHMSPRQFLPIKDLADKFGQIADEVRRVVTRIRQTVEDAP